MKVTGKGAGTLPVPVHPNSLRNGILYMCCHAALSDRFTVPAPTGKRESVGSDRASVVSCTRSFARA